MFMLIQASAREGLTLTKVLHDIPHDAGAVVVYVLLLLFAGFVWLGSRRRST